MFKKVLFGMVGLSLVTSFALAQGEPFSEMSQGDHKMCSECKKHADKFKDASVEEVRAHISKKIAEKEQRIAGEKMCLSKSTKEELLDCIHQFKKIKDSDERPEQGMMEQCKEMKGQCEHMKQGSEMSQDKVKPAHNMQDKERPAHGKQER